MKRLCILLALTVGFVSSTGFAASYTAGNIVVLQCDGSANTGNTASLLEYNPSGTLVSSNGLPSNGGTDNGTSFVVGGSSVLNHDMSISADGALIVIPGYAVTFGSSIDAAAATSVPRVIATMKYNQVYARPITITSGGAVTGNAMRGATSDGFGNFWAVSGGGNVAYATSASTTASSVTSATGRGIGAYNGNLGYTAAPTAGTPGAYAFAGMPTTSASASITLSGTFVTAPAGFSMQNSSAVGAKAYVCNYSDAAKVGIQGFTYNGSSWAADTAAITFSSGTGTDRPQHVAVDYSGLNPVLYFTVNANSTTVAGTKLYKVTDNTSGAGGALAATLLVTAPSGKVFRGVVMAPTQPALPVFTTNPLNTSGNYGDTVSFGPVAATGANPNAWTWKKNGVIVTNGPQTGGSIVSGATSDTLTIAGITSVDGGAGSPYAAVASNNGGSTDSSPAILTLNGSFITQNLVSRTNAAGTTATFTVVANSGNPPYSYAWFLNDNPLSDGTANGGGTISGTATNSISITSVQDADAGTYKVVVTDNTSATSQSSAQLVVDDAPSISAQPGNQNKATGQTATFSVTATGGDLRYQWKKGTTTLTNGPTGNGSTYGGVNTSNLTITAVALADAGSFTVTITNAAGTNVSDPATLTVGQAPIVSVPNSTNVATSTATLAASVIGTGPLTYTWKRDGTTLTDDGHFAGTDTGTLWVTNVAQGDNRTYALTVQNSYGSATASGTIYLKTADYSNAGVPGLIVYEGFNYPVQAYPGFPAPAGWINDWENVISTYNQVTHVGTPWMRTAANGPYSTIEAGSFRDPSGSSSGQYPWPGIDCPGANQWYWSSAPNNNHFQFGGVDQTNGAAYFSFVLNITQGSALNSGNFDLIAGLTTGASTTTGVNADTWNYKLCTAVDNGGDGYYLGVFKGGAGAIGGGSVNGQWATSKHFGRGGLHLIVGCYKFNSGTNLVGGSLTNDDIVTLWIDPATASFGASETNLPAPDAGGMKTNWANNAGINEFALKGTVAPASKRILELRIGTTWASVTGPYYPRLNIKSTPTDVTLSWPTKDSGYVVQESTTIRPTSWVTNTLPPPYTVDGTNNTVTTPIGSGSFYRLVYPPR